MDDLLKRDPVSVVKLLNDGEPLKVCAPMVRFSRLAFRMLARKYGCDLTYTSMFMADSFVKSAKARVNEFVTCQSEPAPFIVQFASNNVDDFVRATELVYGYCDGVDLNCGCPQRWAMSEGYGAQLLKSPQMIYDIVRQTRNQVITNNDFSVSVKLRLKPTIEQTVDMCRQIESAGVSFIGMHGRTPAMRTEPADMASLKIVCDSLQIPVIANGDCMSLDDHHRITSETGARGVMAARGMLENPAMFAGYSCTPLECVQDFLSLCLRYGFSINSFYKLLYWMLERKCSKSERLNITACQSIPQVVDYFTEHYGIHVRTD